MTDGDLKVIHVVNGEACLLEFESGVKVEGRLDQILRRDGKILVMSFSQCRVTFRDRELFNPSWGTFDMAIGEKIVSAYSGPADPFAYQLEYQVPKEKTHKITHSPKALRLHFLYQSVRDIREKNLAFDPIESIWKEVRKDYPEEWLLPLEILELALKNDKFKALASEIRDYLLNVKSADPAIKRLVENGMLVI
jgi:phenylalanine-4-hydroxylase